MFLVCCKTKCLFKKSGKTMQNKESLLVRGIFVVFLFISYDWKRVWHFGFYRNKLFVFCSPQLSGLTLFFPIPPYSLLLSNLWVNIGRNRSHPGLIRCKNSSFVTRPIYNVIIISPQVVYCSTYTFLNVYSHLCFVQLPSYSLQLSLGLFVHGIHSRCFFRPTDIIQSCIILFTNFLIFCSSIFSEFCNLSILLLLSVLVMVKVSAPYVRTSTTQLFSSGRWGRLECPQGMYKWKFGFMVSKRLIMLINSRSNKTRPWIKRSWKCK